jgi:3-oxoacyl-[acyl-carrier-protein] synthase-3
MNTNTKRIAITGLGHSVGCGIRKNNDRVFNFLNDPNNADVAGKDLFTGYENRAVMQNGQTLAGMMVVAADLALEQAELKAIEIDAIIGYASISEYLTPNALTDVHNQLGLKDSCFLIPVQSEYTNYLVALKLAKALLIAKNAENPGFGNEMNVLVVCGSNWTQHVDYHQAPAFSVADGACAAVVSYSNEHKQFALIDELTHVESKWYGSMTSAPRELVPAVNETDPEGIKKAIDSQGVRLGAYTKSVFNLALGDLDDRGGLAAFGKFGMIEPPELVKALLVKHKLKPKDVTIISHQASRKLLDAWKEGINQDEDEHCQYLDTLREWGNMTLASVGVNLSAKFDEIEKDHLVLLGIGVQQETTALLLKRN